MAVEDTTTNQGGQNTPFEVWKPISGYESSYEVSSTGRVRAIERLDSLGRTRPAKVLKLWKRSRYFIIDLFKDGVRDIRSVHHLVYQAFIGSIPEGFHVHHKDENKDNNTPENLQAIDGSAHVTQHGLGRKAWNKGTKYGETEAFRKALATRRKNHAIKCNQARDLRRDGRSAGAISEILGVGKRQVYTLLRSYEGNSDV